jgi:hypothetical protein
VPPSVQMRVRSMRYRTSGKRRSTVCPSGRAGGVNPVCGTEGQGANANTV